MFFFTKKSHSFSLTDLLGFDFKKIDFESIFPFESYATTSLAVATCQEQPGKLMLLNDWQGSRDPIFAQLLSNKRSELHAAIHQQNSSVQIEGAWAKDAATSDDFIHVNSNMPMSDVFDDVFQSHVRQRRPILVNMERSTLLNDKPSRLSALLVRDAFFHVNFLSLSGHYGETAKRVAFRLLHAGRVAYLGFEMDDFVVIAKGKKTELSESVFALLADQSKKRIKASMCVDELPLGG